MRERPRVHFSRLKLMALSPAHYRAGLDEIEETPAMRFGTCVHVLALGGDVIRYPGARTGNGWKAFQGLVDGAEYYVFDDAHRGKAWEWAKADAAGKLIVTSEDLELARGAVELQARRRAQGRYPVPIVTADEYERAALCAEAVRNHPVAARYLEGEVEVPLRWSFLGRDCGGQLDVLAPRRVTDLKTSTSADPDWFPRHAIKQFWHSQLAWYGVGAKENATRVESHSIVAVEVRPPFAVTCFELTDRALDRGRRQVHLWMERLLACEEADEWPEYVQSAVELDLPDDDFELDFGTAA